MKPLIFTTYPSHAAALEALMVLPSMGGMCSLCSKPAILFVQEAPPEGDADRWYIGTICCNATLTDDRRPPIITREEKKEWEDLHGPVYEREPEYNEDKEDR
mgnify:CR=1 FL=1